MVARSKNQRDTKSKNHGGYNWSENQRVARCEKLKSKDNIYVLGSLLNSFQRFQEFIHKNTPEPCDLKTNPRNLQDLNLK